MTIESLRTICKKFPCVTEDIKWENDLCFCIGEKMFLIVGLDREPAPASFKVTDEDFEELSGRDGFAPAKYLARYKWISTEDINKTGKKEWEYYASKSYEIIKSKLTKKKLKELGLV